MLIEFSVENFKSIKSLQTISFVAEPIVSKEKGIDKENTFVQNNIPLLKSIALYGANGSGKSNLINALLAMIRILDESFANDKVIGSLYQPFALSTVTEKKPVFFQIVFTLGNVIYRYGFQFNKDGILSEWLFGKSAKKESYYFLRTNDEIKVNRRTFLEGSKLTKGKTKRSTLFLNVTNAFNGTISTDIIDFFNYDIAISAGITHEGFGERSAEWMDDKKMKKQIVGFLKYADLGIEDLERETKEKKEFDTPSKLAGYETQGEKINFVFSKRYVYNSKGEISHTIAKNIQLFESEGTQKLFSISGPVLAALNHGKILIIDEFDSRLHPLITKAIVKIFNSKKHNRFNAQLLFVTHDINLLDNSILRRDQFYFAEKNTKGETEFYSLSGLKGVRNDTLLEKEYTRGKFGATPYLGEFSKIVL